jgi:bifunctional non-homologous end joining protein LigD
MRKTKPVADARSLRMAGRSLATYRAKRDFGVTAEPSGEKTAPASERGRFVVQKHAATRLHYDLRLEHRGVFLSWAVTRGPSCDPHDRRLAVQVEDHPIAYGDFEGTIPQGQYGGGTVMLWDRGWWAPEPGFDVDQGLARGELKVVFAGERLKGGYALVRIKHDRAGGKRDNWLLIKHRDEFAREPDPDFLEETSTSIASGRTMEQIAAGVGPGPTPFIMAKGPATDTVWNSSRSDPDPPPAQPRRRAKSGTGMPSFVEPELCKSLDRPPAGPGWAHEIKFDGYRMQLRVEAGRVTLLTRTGQDWTQKFPAIAEAARALPDALIDGEIVALGAVGSPDFAGLQAALSAERTDELIFFAFDLLFSKGEDLRDLALEDRKAQLKALLGGNRIRYVEHFTSAGDAVLSSACRMALEGIVSKRLDAPYRSGRSGAWTKSKCRAGHEAVLGGWTTTDGRFRSLIAGVYRDGQLIHVGRIGTGFGAAKLAALLPRLKALETDRSPFVGPNALVASAGVHWLKPELVAEIEYAGFTGDGNIRQAAFKGLREDKPALEVEAEAPAPAETVELAQPSPEPPARGRPGQGGAAVMGVTITNPDKPLWPAHADARPVTKLELARYYEAVAPWMIPHLKGRPCSLVRIPDGIEAEQIFQRHAMRGSSALISEVTVSGDRKPYLQIDRPEALAAVAQIAAAELHPWNCAPSRPDQPGRLVFDLDPAPDVPFEQVIDAAREIRDRIEALGLVAFCKTTGGKGLHVVTPLKPPGTGGPDWPAAKAFAREVCARMAVDSPDRFLITMAKKAREGRIFLDYLRNDRMSTAVAPLSPRARPGATVSMPLTWAEVRRGLDPTRYTLRTTAALLQASSAWEAYYESKRDLAEAIRRLG